VLCDLQVEVQHSQRLVSAGSLPLVGARTQAFCVFVPSSFLLKSWAWMSGTTTDNWAPLYTSLYGLVSSLCRFSCPRSLCFRLPCLLPWPFSHACFAAMCFFSDDHPRPAELRHGPSVSAHHLLILDSCSLSSCSCSCRALPRRAWSAASALPQRACVAAPFALPVFAALFSHDVGFPCGAAKRATRWQSTVAGRLPATRERAPSSVRRSGESPVSLFACL
jgi:hypothetical protein